VKMSPTVFYDVTILFMCVWVVARSIIIASERLLKGRLPFVIHFFIFNFDFHMCRDAQPSSRSYRVHIIKMDIFYDHHNFKKVIFDWMIQQPDQGYQYVTSLLACAILCGRYPHCTTICVKPIDTHILCQMSTRRGTCLEKEEAYNYLGSLMYQKKVTSGAT
jgi:hypothetical protein